MRRLERRSGTRLEEILCSSFARPVMPPSRPCGARLRFCRVDHAWIFKGRLKTRRLVSVIRRNLRYKDDCMMNSAIPNPPKYGKMGSNREILDYLGPF